MSREQSALEAVQALIPDDTIIDVALTHPRGYTKAQGVGMAAGSLMGFGSDFQGVGAVLGSVAGGKVFGNLKELPQSFVLAISDSTVYVLGRDSMAVVGHWDHMVKMVKFDRKTLLIDVHQRLVTLEITLTDTEHDVRLELEAKRLGNLGVKAITDLLLSDHSATEALTDS
ncbi:MAG: hypothetical protein HY828_04095 [Actinobacteria bacterium]|nr:hypothetical protein [Actinomycetota bacterium]